MSDTGIAVASLLYGELSRQERREKISRLEEGIKAHPNSLGEDPFPLEHTFVPGVYARQIIAPKGALIVTKIHKTEHLIFMLSGEVSVLTEEGVERLVGPCMFISRAGIKRAVYVHEETVWINVHANPQDITDLGVIESIVIASSYDELPAETKPCLG